MIEKIESGDRLSRRGLWYGQINSNKTNRPASGDSGTDKSSPIKQIAQLEGSATDNLSPIKQIVQLGKTLGRKIKSYKTNRPAGDSGTDRLSPIKQFAQLQGTLVRTD